MIALLSSKKSEFRAEFSPGRNHIVGMKLGVPYMLHAFVLKPDYCDSAAGVWSLTTLLDMWVVPLSVTTFPLIDIRSDRSIMTPRWTLRWAHARLSPVVTPSLVGERKFLMLLLAASLGHTRTLLPTNTHFSMVYKTSMARMWTMSATCSLPWIIDLPRRAVLVKRTPLPTLHQRVLPRRLSHASSGGWYFQQGFCGGRLLTGPQRVRRCTHPTLPQKLVQGHL